MYHSSAAHVLGWDLRNVLWKPQVYPPRPSLTLVYEQVLVRRCLLKHLHVQVIPVRPFLRVAVVCVANETGEVGLLVGALAGESVEDHGCR